VAINAMSNESIEKIHDWPQPSTVGEASINACHRPFLISYATRDEKLAVIEIHLCHQLIYGHPNDETLHGHPLFKSGLDFYTVYKINNSSLLALLEARNAVHPRHDKANYLAEKVHYVITFQDATLEFVATSSRHFPVKVHVFDDLAQAEAALGRHLA
jgi:hypothetical protein